ncbi:MAG: GAF domain-containing protein [Anaerolineae bacterium]|nr:GAF domain-containing protein [Anaerolineae bacterium]
MTGSTTLLKFGKWPVLYKTMVTIIIIVALVLGIATFVHASVLRTSVREQVGAKFAALADGRMGVIADALAEQLALLRGMAVDSTLIDAVQTANANYTGSAEAIQVALLEIDHQWLNAADDSTLIQASLNPSLNPVAAQLLAYVKTFPVHGEIFITDRYGGLVAATGRLSDYYQADEAWWQAAYHNRQGALYIDQPAYDESAGYIALNMAVPILSPRDGMAIGVLRSTVNIDFLAGAFETLPGERTGVTLTNDQRLILADSNSGHVGQSAPSTWRLYTGSPGALWFEDNTIDGEPLVIGRASIRDALIGEDSLAEAVDNLNWYLFIYQTQAEAYAQIRNRIWTMAGVLALLLLSATVVAWLMARSLSSPLKNLHTVMRRWLDGDRTQRAQSRWPDEAGELAETFNTIATSVEEMDETLSRRASEREREEKRRARQLETTTAIGEVVSVTSDVTVLAQGVVELLYERFALYFAGLYLLDDTGKWLVLYAGSGDPTQQMLSQDYRIAADKWVVGRCVTEGKTTITRDTDVDNALLFDRSQLPHTRVAIAMPLRSRGRILGAIEAHSDQPEMLDAESAVVLQTIADQVAVAIDSVQMYAERQEAMESLQRAYGEVTREAWEALLSGRTAGPEGYQAEIRRIMPLAAAPPETWGSTARAAWSEGRVVLEESPADQAPDGAEPSLALPIRLRDEILGVVDVSKRGDAGEWKPEEIAQLEHLVEQLGLTLEVSRFYQESRRAAAREQLLREVSERIRVAVDVDSVMRITAQEVGAVLKRPVFVYLENEADDEGRNVDG